MWLKAFLHVHKTFHLHACFNFVTQIAALEATIASIWVFTVLGQMTVAEAPKAACYNYSLLNSAHDSADFDMLVLLSAKPNNGHFEFSAGLLDQGHSEVSSILCIIFLVVSSTS